MASKQKAPKEPSDVVLRYGGKGRFRGVPARHLTQGDIDRLVYLRRYAETASDGRRPDKSHPDAGLVKSITAELVGSGLYKPEV